MYGSTLASSFSAGKPFKMKSVFAYLERDPIAETLSHHHDVEAAGSIPRMSFGIVADGLPKLATFRANELIVI